MFLRAARRATHTCLPVRAQFSSFAAAAAGILSSVKLAGGKSKPSAELLAYLESQTLDEAYGVQRYFTVCA